MTRQYLSSRIDNITELCKELSALFPMCHFAIFCRKQPCIVFEICRKSSGIGISDSQSNMVDCKICRCQEHFRVAHTSLLDIFRNCAMIDMLKRGLQLCCTHTGNSRKSSKWKFCVEMVIDIGSNIIQGIHVLLGYFYTRIIFITLSVFINKRNSFRDLGLIE